MNYLIDELKGCKIRDFFGDKQEKIFTIYDIRYTIYDLRITNYSATPLFTNSPAYQLANLPAYQLTNLPTCQLTNLRTCQLLSILLSKLLILISLRTAERAGCFRFCDVVGVSALRADPVDF